MRCLIVAGGTFGADALPDHLFDHADLIIAADGGADHLRRINRLPHIIIGDLDSIRPETRAFYEARQVAFKPFPARKDQTDTELCVGHALENGATQVVILGGTGSRLDHTLANILLLRRLADKGVSAHIRDENNEIYLVQDRLELTGTPGDLLSLIPVSEKVLGVSLEGLEYPLENHTLAMGSSLGVSNCFKGKKAVVTVKEGTLIVTKSRD